jgi:hypothetical protein
VQIGCGVRLVEPEALMPYPGEAQHGGEDGEGANRGR